MVYLSVSAFHIPSRVLEEGKGCGLQWRTEANNFGAKQTIHRHPQLRQTRDEGGIRHQAVCALSTIRTLQQLSKDARTDHVGLLSGDRVQLRENTHENLTPRGLCGNDAKQAPFIACDCIYAMDIGGSMPGRRWTGRAVFALDGE